MTAKQKSLNQTEQNVRHATRSLADKRQQMQRSQASLAELEQNKLKSEKLRKALSAVDTHNYSGRSDDGSSAFRTLASHLAPQITGSLGRDFPLPSPGDPNAVITLRRRRDWESRISQVLEQRVKSLEGEGLDKELKYRRLVSVCTEVPVDKVDAVSILPSHSGFTLMYRCWTIYMSLSSLMVPRLILAGLQA
jgi:regulatory protein SWI6